ncbi:MAG TPA: crotonase/enoyl-CoA hydratase family protein [Acidimicrobiales bacterium]
MTDALTTTTEGPVAVLTIDDGRANALTPELIAALQSAFDRAEAESGAVVLVGRPGRFCAGFDLSVMRQGGDATRSLVGDGAELLLRMWTSPLPVVAACTGSAVAAGALLLLASDVRIGADVEARIGLNEVAIGLGLPVFAIELARARLDPRRLTGATLLARLMGVGEAVDAGYLDRAVAADDLVGEAIAEASRLAELPRGAFALSKERVRAATVAHIRASLDEDLAVIGPPTG